MQDALSVAIARFPSRRSEIETLAVSSDSFRSLCADLAEAVGALNWWKALTSPKGERHAREYEAIVGSLLDELEAALDFQRQNATHRPPQGNP
jgi:hypothetical protein